ESELAPSSLPMILLSRYLLNPLVVAQKETTLPNVSQHASQSLSLAEFHPGTTDRSTHSLARILTSVYLPNGDPTPDGSRTARTAYDSQKYTNVGINHGRCDEPRVMS
ncbi:hypothetical protein T310_10220, partial [Rasamsonia emersonii CBS 393.64]